MSDYNYAVFDMAQEEPHFLSFRDRLHAGDRVPDLSLEDLDTGAAVLMKSLWRSGLAVLEFGSFT